MLNSTPTTAQSQRLHKFRKSRRNALSTASTGLTSYESDNVPTMSRHRFCGIVEEAALRAREKRQNRTIPQPWVVRKIAVFLTFGIMGYSGYVYISRFCITSIKRTHQSTTGRPTAIVVLVIFCILYLWMIWAYFKVILTSPGYAREHVPQCRRPLLEPLDTRHSDFDLENSLVHYNSDFDHSKPHQFDPTRPHRFNRPSHSSVSSHNLTHGNRVAAGNLIAGPSYEDIALRSPTLGRSISLDRVRQPTNETGTRVAGDALVTEVDDGGVGEGRLRTPFEPPFTIFLPDHVDHQGNADAPSDLPTGQIRELGALGNFESRNSQPRTPIAAAPPSGDEPIEGPAAEVPCNVSCLSDGALCNSQRRDEKEKKEITVRRRLSPVPVLHPAHRYCFHDQIVKPYRAHHCRNCGTCVLKFDHHCPWIGQCVGARNHKFFLNFCQATLVFTLYVLGTLVGFNVSAWTALSSNSHVDAQIIVVSALAALFALFTGVLTWTHIILITRGQTTVESIAIHAMKEQEAATLTREYGICGFGAKREARRRWNEDWGDLNSEGNLWWTGSKRQGWIDVMGTSPLGWILPIGRGSGDGLSYAVNPRFDGQGRMRRRVDWPAELR